MSKNAKLYDYVTLGFRLSALVEKCSIFRCFVWFNYGQIQTVSKYVPPYMKGFVRLSVLCKLSIMLQQMHFYIIKH
jgi:hypothetical protein